MKFPYCELEFLFSELPSILSFVSFQKCIKNFRQVSNKKVSFFSTICWEHFYFLMSDCYSSLLLLVVSSVLPTILEFGAPKSWFNFSKYLETPCLKRSLFEISSILQKDVWAWKFTLDVHCAPLWTLTEFKIMLESSLIFLKIQIIVLEFHRAWNSSIKTRPFFEFPVAQSKTNS